MQSPISHQQFNDLAAILDCYWFERSTLKLDADQVAELERYRADAAEFRRVNQIAYS